MEKISRCTVAYGDNVEPIAFGRGDIKLLSEPTLTGGQTMTFSRVIVTPGAIRANDSGT